MPSRRRYLGTLVTGLGMLAGCTSESNDEGPDANSTEDPSSNGSTPTPSNGTPTGTEPETAGEHSEEDPLEADEPESDDDLTVVVQDIVARDAITYGMYPPMEVLSPPDHQFVVVKLFATGSIDRDALAFETPERAWRPFGPGYAQTTTREVAGLWGWPLAMNDPPFVAVFRIPSPLVAEEYDLRYRGETVPGWGLSHTQRQRLRRPSPVFELERFEAPDLVIQGERVQFDVVARNVSDTPGRFLAAIHWPRRWVSHDRPSIVRGFATPGERINYVDIIGTSGTARENITVTVSLDGYVEAERDVEVRVMEDPF